MNDSPKSSHLTYKFSYNTQVYIKAMHDIDSNPFYFSNIKIRLYWECPVIYRNLNEMNHNIFFRQTAILILNSLSTYLSNLSILTRKIDTFEFWHFCHFCYLLHQEISIFSSNCKYFAFFSCQTIWREKSTLWRFRHFTKKLYRQFPSNLFWTRLELTFFFS